MIARVNLLGAARVVFDDGSSLGLRPTMRDQALTYLACAGGWVARDRLAYLFWPDTSDRVARHNVRQLLKRIRRLPWLDNLELDRDSVRWSIPTDLDRLRAVTHAADDDLPSAGEFLPGLERNATVEYEAWLLSERERLRTQWRSALLEASAVAERAGRFGRAARLLQPLLDGDLVEDVLPRYMELAVLAGDAASAQTAFVRAAQRLRSELDVEPPEDARRIARRLEDTGISAPSSPQGLFVGRADAIREIRGLLSQPTCRLLTLLGPGGIGKSTLARMVVDHLATRYADGATVVSLESITDDAVIPLTLASRLCIALDGRRPATEQLISALGRAHQLVVLDNVEHLSAGWSVFTELLRGCPRLVIVVTSRERLRLDDEWVYPVEGLPDGEAVELFEQRARRVAPLATVARGHALAVVQAVGGSPLGIELAAPWLRVMSCEEIAREIDSNPLMLDGGRRDGAPRHRSIEAAMAHSWALASSDERDAVEALSTFCAPYSRALAAQVSGATPIVLRSLVDKSLVQHRLDGRYASHPLVRQYAAARLAADTGRRRALRARHAAAVLALLNPPDRAIEHADLVDDAINAWRCAVDSGDADLVYRSTEGLVRLIDASGRYAGGLQLLEEAVSTLGRGDPVRPAAAVEWGRSFLLQRLGRHVESIRTARGAADAARESGDRRVLVLALLTLAWSRKWLDGDCAQYEASSEALAIAETLHDDPLLVQVLNSLGCSAPALEECSEYLERGAALAGTAGLEDLQANLLANLGMVAWALGDHTAALRHLQESLDKRKRGPLVPNIIGYLAFVNAELGGLDTAWTLATEAESLCQDKAFVDQKMYVALVAGEIRRLLGDVSGARARMREGLRMAQANGNDSYALRALRLQGQLLMDEGRCDEGLGLLAFVLPRAGRRGDFTSEILCPRIWKERTAGLDPQSVQRAQDWARERTLADLIESVLTQRDS